MHERWRHLAVLLALLSLGCVPVTCEQKTLLRPEVAFHVERAETGEPIEGATVTLCRWKSGPPPASKLNEWTESTDAQGNATFAYEEETEDVAPLMMHGVPQHEWKYCVAAEGYAEIAQVRPSTYANGELLSEEMNADPASFGRDAAEITLVLEPSGNGAIELPCSCESEK